MRHLQRAGNGRLRAGMSPYLPSSLYPQLDSKQQAELQQVPDLLATAGPTEPCAN